MPLAPLALAFAAGIALAAWLPANAGWSAWVIGLAGGVALLVTGRVWGAVASLLLGVAALGALRASPSPLPATHIARLGLPSPGRVEARLSAEPVRWAPDRTRLLLDAERADDRARTGLIQATLYGLSPPLTQGQRIAAELRLRRASGYRNPGVFDYAAHLAREQIHVVATGRGAGVIVLDDPPPPWPVSVKRRALAAIGRALPPTSAALLGGLLLGDRTALPREIDDAFRRAGVYHVLAVSGFNVAILASSVFALSLAARASRRVAAVAAMVVVVGFAFVVGPEPSVVRATIMGVLVLGAILLEREAAVLNSLALAALAILAARPGDLGDPGFQLSFAATAAIVLAPLPRGVLLGSLGVSAAAQLAVLPITLTHFNQISTIGLVANLAVVPLAAAATVIGVAAVAVSTFTDAGGVILFNAVWPLLVGMRAVVALAASVPGAAVHLPAPHWTATVAYVAALVLALAAWRRRTEGRLLPRLIAGVAAALLGIAVAVSAWPLVRPPDGWLRITVLDVGQGDAIVVETPDGRALLIDAGPGGAGRLDTGERVVAPFLWNRGHLRLAATLVTHDDLDHAGGMAAIRRLFPVAETWDAGAYPARRWLGGIAVSTFDAGGAGLAGNDAALVVRLELGLATFLLTSDIGARAERELLQRGVPLAATVLKVAHHGSSGSSTPPFLRAVRPIAAVISVGARNRYGHPAAGTLERLAAAGATTYRTDRDGAVIFETDGRRLTVTRWASRRVDHYCLEPETIC
jgi:competence protein ComEC